jgi:glutamine synthetase
MFEAYAKAIAIEAQTALSLATTSILPAAFAAQDQVSRAITHAHTASKGIDLASQERLLATIASRITNLLGAIDVLQTSSDEAERQHGGPREHAMFLRDKVVPAVQRVREAVDALELVVDDELWPLPKYRELLFVH